MVERLNVTTRLRRLGMIIVASLMLALAALATPFFAERAFAAVSGTTGNCTWGLDDEGTLTIAPIEGTDGKMEDYTYAKEAPWDSRRYDVLCVVIEPGVASVGDRAFYYCSYLKEVSLPSTLTSIGDDAFYMCDSLAEVDIPEGVVSIGDDAFYWCDSLTEASLPSTLTSVGDSAFFRCSSLTEVAIPEGVASIGSHTFAGCDSLISIAVESGNASYSSLGGVLFSADGGTLVCYPGGGPQTYSVPEGVTSIGGAFYWCGYLKEVSLPSTLTSIGSSAFTGCDSLASITVESGNANYSSLDGVLFSADGGTLICYPEGGARAYSVPEGVTSIGYGAFEYCSLIEVSLPSTLTSIGSSAFSDCDSLTEVTIPEGVTSIGSFAFGWCNSLAEVTVPKSATSIGSYAFTGLPKGSVITVSTQSQYDLLTGDDADRYIKVGSTTVVLSSGAKDIAQAEFSAIDDQLYTGGELTPEVVVAYEGETLKEGMDYVVSYENNLEVGQATVVVSGKGYFTGCKTIEFDILPVDMSDVFVGSIAAQTYAGSAVEPKLTLSFNGRALIEELDYEVSYADNVNVGTAAAVVMGKGNFSGEIRASFEIEPATLTAAYEGESLAYGAAPALVVSVTGFVGGETAATAAGYVAPTLPHPEVLEEGGSYELTPRGGAADNYEFEYESGVLTVVAPTKVEVPSAVSGLAYTNSEQTGVVAGEGYELSGSVSAVSAGSYEATATLLEGYVWSDGTKEPVSVEWFIAPADISLASIAKIPTQAYTGSAIEPDLALTFRGMPLVEGVDYEVSYSGNVEAGTATAIVTGLGNFEGTVEADFNISIAAGKYALLKEYIQSEGLTNSSGNRYIDYADGDIYARITYMAEDGRFEFVSTYAYSSYWEPAVRFTIEETGSDSVEVFYEDSYNRWKARTVLDVAEYEPEDLLKFEKVSGYFDINDAQDVFNTHLRLAFTNWEILLLIHFGLDINMGDLGFVAYEKFITEGPVNVSNRGQTMAAAVNVTEGRTYNMTWDSSNRNNVLWNKVVLDEGGYVALTAESTKYYVNLAICDSGGSVLYEGKFTKSDGAVLLNYGLSAGCYYIKFWNGYSTNGLTYNLEIEEGVDCEREPNELFSEATMMGIGEKYLAHYSRISGSESDYWSFEPAAGASYKLILEGYERIESPTLLIYGPDRRISDYCTDLAYDDTLNAYVCEFECDQSGEWCVSLWMQSSTAPYTIQIQEMPQPAWKSFTDTPASAWYVTNGTLDYVIARGIMSGTSETTFEPGGQVTRAQVATILYNLTGRPEVGAAEVFSDVEAGSWYHDAVMWARSAGVVSGYDDGSFKPGVSVTREQLACMLRNYVGNVAGLDVAVGAGGLGGFADAAGVSTWAYDSVAWCVGQGIIAGTPSGGSVFVNPQGTAVRAEAAQMVRAFDEKVLGA